MGKNSDIISTYVKNANNFTIIPVPKGFTVSSLDSENDINKGIVIYENENKENDFEPVNSDNYEIAMKTRN